MKKAFIISNFDTYPPLIFSIIPFLKKTVMPIKIGHVDPDCWVYHLSNYYANESGTNIGTIKFAHIIQ